MKGNQHRYLMKSFIDERVKKEKERHKNNMGRLERELKRLQMGCSHNAKRILSKPTGDGTPPYEECSVCGKVIDEND